MNSTLGTACTQQSFLCILENQLDNDRIYYTIFDTN